MDDHNRWRTSHAAQVPVRFKTYDGKDPLGFVVSHNLHRRHLDASQRAMIAATLYALTARPVEVRHFVRTRCERAFENAAYGHDR